jgi:hypothetical protein
MSGGADGVQPLGSSLHGQGVDLARIVAHPKPEREKQERTVGS